MRNNFISSHLFQQCINEVLIECRVQVNSHTQPATARRIIEMARQIVYMTIIAVLIKRWVIANYSYVYWIKYNWGYMNTHTRAGFPFRRGLDLVWPANNMATSKLYNIQLWNVEQFKQNENERTALVKVQRESVSSAKWVYMQIVILDAVWCYNHAS